jgi:secondary thiamine-phosphate synthase enzyme
LTINENADPDVRTDLETALNHIVPADWNRDGTFRHTLEGDDDMPGHVKSSLMGASLNVPITNGRLALGTWQGIYLCEHRDQGGYGGGHARKIVVTLQGQGK